MNDVNTIREAMNEDLLGDLNPPKCESCGVPWTDHLGMIGTCRQLQEARAEIATLKAQVATLTVQNEGLCDLWVKP